MNCKYCDAEIEQDVTVCPFCGRDISEETPEKETTAAEATSVEEAPAEEAPAEEAPAEEAPVEEASAEEIPAEENPTEDAPTGDASAEDVLTNPENDEPAEAKPGHKGLKITLAVIAGVLVLGILAAAVLYGLGVRLKLPTNDITYSSNYTVEDEKVEQQGQQVIATMGDKTLTNSDLQTYYWMTVNNFLSSNQSYLTYLGLDYTKPLNEQICSQSEEGYNWQQYFLEGALTNWHQYAAVSAVAQEEGFELAADAKEYLQTLPEKLNEMATQYEYESAEAMLKNDMGAGATVAGYTNYLTAYYMAINYLDSKNESLTPTAEDMEAYFAENEEALSASGITKESGKLIDVRHILLQPENGTTDEAGATTYSDVDWEICRVKAQTLYDSWKAGDATQDSFAALATANSADTGSSSNGGLYTQVPAGQMVTEFNDWIFDETRQPGDSGLVKTQYGYHIMYFVGGEESWIINCRSKLMTQRVTALFDDALEKHPMKVNYRKIALGALSLGS